MSVYINASAFRASLFTMGKKDIRSYINGAYLDFTKGRIVSTNGHTLFCGKIPRSDRMPNVIVPREAIEDALKIIGKRNEDRWQFDVTVTHTEASLKGEGTPIISIVAPGATISASGIDGRFPEYERIIPPIDSLSGETAVYDPDLLADCRNAIRAYSSQHKRNMFWFKMNGDAVAVMPGPDCLAAVMPVRAGEEYDCDWFHGKPEPETLEEAA